VIAVVTLVFFPWSGVSEGCGMGKPGAVGSCVREYLSPLGLSYPEWLGAVFYFLLLCLLAWVFLTPFRRLDEEPEVDETR
jgi:disulfide bond formation protein DsbB